MTATPAERPRITARAEKASRLAVAGAIAAPFGLAGVYTDNEALGYAAVGIVLFAILFGPLIARLRGAG